MEINMELPERKTIRLNGYDYRAPGYYFVTFCTKEKRKLLCDIVGTGVPDGPRVRFTKYGEIAARQLQIMCTFYENMELEKYVIMPNHIHLLIHIKQNENGPSGRPVPTNAPISKFVGTFKRFCNKEYGEDIWQARSHDHIIRGERDYKKIWEYIDNNPAKWAEDCFYTE